MKNYLTFIFIIVALSLNAQDMRDRRGMENRIEQLEKAKLIETLNLSEEQSIRFFARRNEHRKQMQNFDRQIDELTRNLEKSLRRSDEGSIAEQKKLIEDLLNLRIQMEKSKKDFILSLNDILTTEQISKLILFERQFREEIRKVLMKRKGLPKDN